MKVINELLKKNNIRATCYKKMGNVILVNTNKGKYIVKENNINKAILDYLNNRGFNEYPKTIFDREYIISKYEEESNIPKEQKMFDLVDTISLLHAKTSFYKETSDYEYKTIYEDIINNLEHLYNYYNNYIENIDNIIIYSPSEFLLSRNISYILNSIDICKKYIDSWYKKVEKLNKMRVSVIHNNIDMSHFIRNKKSYLISWDRSKIDIPIFDLYTLYNKYYREYNFNELLKKYEKEYQLKDYEKLLLLVLINIPNKIEYTNEYDTCVKISNEIDRLYKSNELLEQYKNSLIESLP